MKQCSRSCKEKKYDISCLKERKEIQKRRFDALRDAVKFFTNSRALRTLMSDEGEKQSFSVYLAL